MAVRKGDTMPGLEEITKDNIHLYCRFEKDFENELKYFQSRIYPENSDFFAPLIKDGLLRWSYIISDGRPIGAIWLEKEHTCLSTAKLGIFIAEKDMRCKGIGRKAIEQFIQRNKKELKLNQVTLNVRKENIRAIRCYEKCGFVSEQQYEKPGGIKVLKMIKSL